MAATYELTETEARNRELLRWDFPLLAENCLVIVNKRGQRQYLTLKPEQRRFWDAVREQRDAQLPVRAIVLKARQLGFCLAPETRVLTADLRWVSLDEIEPGQEIVATDENVPGGRGKGRKMRRAVVEKKCEVHEPAFRISLSNGQTLVATAPHRFLCRKRGGVDTEWRMVGKMRVGDSIRHICEPWGESSVEDGWIGGMIDGEGCLAVKAKGGTELSIAQRPGPVFSRVAAYMAERGYTFREEMDDRPSRNGKPVGKVCLHRTNELLRIIGQSRPSRFVDSGWWEDRDLPGKRSGIAWAQITAIESLGPQRMIDLQTSESTYIAEGFVSHNSTAIQGMAIQRATQFSDHHALTLAQEHGTAGELFGIGRRMWEFLPDEADLKPKLVGRRKDRRLEFDNDSWYRADSAKEFESGRGLTIHTLHVSEVAFYPDAQRKLTGLLQAVPNEPGTFIALESTANGQNYFKDLWDAASAGESDYIPFFSPWFEEPTYVRVFANASEREDFQASLNEGTIGEDEPDLQSMGCSLEQLHWRRWVIRNNFAGDLDRFRQEFPSTPLEAFMTTGRHVFNVGDVRRVQMQVKSLPEPETGTLQVVGKMEERRSRGVTVHIPKTVQWVPGPVNDDRHPGWKIWEHPVPKRDDAPAGQYVGGVDASGDDLKEGATAYHVISICDHRTRAQVAEYRSRIDPDELAFEIYKACLYYNRPWMAIEVTGSWGGPAARRLARDFRYPFVYKRQRLSSSSEKWEDSLGWHTGFGEKKLLIAEMREMLRTDEHGIRSRGLAEELGWYVLDDRNRMKPEFGKTGDRIIARGISVSVAREKPLRPERKRGEVSSTVDGLQLGRTGYRS